ncbi:unnamed protein product, partial [Vitis vinifera]|uniref:ELMO domain-containing protein n=1 Tax=Vitis vinifera TaxID=29760 RepID=D7SX79_VITVI
MLLHPLLYAQTELQWLEYQRKQDSFSLFSSLMNLSIGLQDALRELWSLAYPGRELPSLKSELWNEMGWQGTDPSTDFRGGGFISLENLIFFAKKYPVCFMFFLSFSFNDIT